MVDSMIHQWTAAWGTRTAVVLAGQLTMDETWAPFIQANSIGVVMPAGFDAAELDPRTEARVVLTLTMTPPGALSPTVTRDFDLGVRSCEIDYLAGTLNLSLSSDEALVQEHIMFGNPSTVSNSLWNVAASAIQSALPTAIVEDQTFGAATFTDVYSLKNLTPWELFNPIAQKYGCRVYCAADRTFYVTSLIYASSIADQIELSYLTNLTGASVTLNRDSEWADGVLIAYSDMEVWLEDGGSSSKGMKLERPDNTFTGYTEAEAYLSARLRRGDEGTLTAVSDYTAEPGGQLAVTLPDGTTFTDNISSVSFTCDTDEMTIRPREWTA